MWRFFKNAFVKPEIPCRCGGTIREAHSWVEAYQACDRCGREVSQQEFERKARRSSLHDPEV